MKKIKGVKFLLYVFPLLSVVLLCNLLFADTVKLSDGSILVGKIIKDDSSKIIFKNSYGSFKIKKRQVKKIYVTRNYNEDIQIHKKLGKDFNEATIKKNYLAGLAKREEVKKANLSKGSELKEKDSTWTSMRISISGTHIVTTGRLKKILPKGSGALIAFDQGMDFIIGSKRHFLMPGFRLEVGYLRYEKDPAKVDCITSSGGLLWLFPFIKNGWGNIVLSSLPGVTFLNIEKNSYKESSSTFTLHSLVGYEYSIGAVTIFLHGRYMFVYDKDVNLNGIGGDCGIGMRIW
ncbi:MAG: hypothetical protein SVZ03_14770 [Spirochaetota bacterium]|nr:hypothetical protein [Spirochaetota bacterium]